MPEEPALLDPPPADRATPAGAIRALGFDPGAVQAVILTPTSAVAIAADYPEPYVMPTEEVPDGSN